MDDLYRQNILDHYHQPRGWGLTTQAQFQEKGVNPLCGDDVTVQIDVVNSQISGWHFEGHGCALSVASASLLGEYILNKSVKEVEDMNAEDIQQLLGVHVQPTRLKCALLPLKTVQLALTRANLA